MNSPPPVDPLEAVDFLAGEISAEGAGDILALIRAVDTLVYSLHFIGPDIPAIEPTDAEPPQMDYGKVYGTVRQRYPSLGQLLGRPLSCYGRGNGGRDRDRRCDRRPGRHLHRAL